MISHGDWTQWNPASFLSYGKFRQSLNRDVVEGSDTELSTGQ